MGLDAYIYGHKLNSDEEHEELAYWRKHPALNRFIIKEFGDLLLTYEDHNGKKIPLTLEKLEKILDHHERCDLLFADGFFHGSSSDYWLNDDDEGWGRKQYSEDMIRKVISYLKEDENHAAYYVGDW